MYDLQATALYGGLQLVSPLKAGFFFSKRNDLSNDGTLFCGVSIDNAETFLGGLQV